MITIKQWLFKKGNALLIVSGLMLGLAAPGIGVWPLVWLGLLPAFLVLFRACSAKSAFSQGLLVGSLYHAVVFSWFWGLHPLTWMGFPPAASLGLTLAGWITCWLEQGLITGIIFAAAHLLQRRFGQTGQVAFLPLLWVGCLWFLNLQPIGLPWGFLTYTQADIPWIRQSAYWLTFWGLEAVIVWFNVAMAQAVHYRAPRKAVMAVTGLLLLLWIGRTSPPETAILRQLNPAVLQGSLSIEAERTQLAPADKIAYYQRQINVGLAKAEPSPQLLVLPEGVISTLQVDSAVPFALPPQTALLAGGIYPTETGWHNGALLYQASKPPQAMGKRYLVPFGEATPFIPEEWLIRLLSLFNISYAKGFAALPHQQPPLILQHLHSGRNLKTIDIGVLVCFEALYPNITRHYRTSGTHLLVTLGNLGWYHQNPMLEAQFLAINRLRAAESGMPMILAANTGISALIDANGAVLTRTRSGLPEWLTLSGAYPLATLK